MPTYDVLTARMAGIGLRFTAEPDVDANIESTLLFASVSGMEQESLRTLGVLTTWLGVHHSLVNAHRLVRAVSTHPSDRVRAYWASIAQWLRADRRLAPLESFHRGFPIDLLPVGSKFQIQRRGEDTRFVGSKLLVPKGTLRDRVSDVLAPDALARQHAGYRYRVLMGPSVRADVWTILEESRDMCVEEVARRAACSLAAASQASRDFTLFRASCGRVLPPPNRLG